MRRPHTEEMKERAKQADILAVAQEMGYTVTKKTHSSSYCSLKEHDSVVFYPSTNSYYRHSTRRGGDVIAFVQELGPEQGYNMDIYDTIEWLLTLQGEKPEYIYSEQNRKKKEQVPFKLPEPLHGKYKRAYAYLTQTRGIDVDVINYFIKNKLMYESAEHHNIVFVGHNKEGVPVFASQRGTADAYGKKFKCDVPGNDKNYGISIINPLSDKLYVFESGIDMMSYITLTGDYDNNMLALGMVADNPLVRFLEDYKHIKVIGFGLDRDKAGRDSTTAYSKKYSDKGYKTEDLTTSFFSKAKQNYPIELDDKCKDFNELLLEIKQTRMIVSKGR